MSIEILQCFLLSYPPFVKWNAVTFPPGTVLSLGYHQRFGFEAMVTASTSSVALEMLQHLLHFQKLPFLGSALFPPSTQAHARFRVKQMLWFLSSSTILAQNEAWIKLDCGNPWAIWAVILGDSLGQKWYRLSVIRPRCFWDMENLGSSSDSSWSYHSLQVLCIPWIPPVRFVSSGRSAWQGKGLGRGVDCFSPFLVSM